MKVGIFHPTLNTCGGAEWVAVKIMAALTKEDHGILVLTNEPINWNKIKSIFGETLSGVTDVVTPFEPFRSTDMHNVYTDGLRTLFLKSKCDVVIDTSSNALLPGVNISYIHFPLFGRLDWSHVNELRKSYYLGYRLYERIEAKYSNRLVFSNSKYTEDAIRKFTGINSVLLYPPISGSFYNNTNQEPREDVVITVARIDPGKRLTLIPKIAKMTNRKIRFVIIGLQQSKEELERILKLIDEYKVSDRVEVRTNVSQKDLQNMLSTSKVYLHTSAGEHFGVSLAQAMASGCIPITYDAGGPREFVPENYRFTLLKEAARKIEKAAFEWTSQDSIRISNIARLFIEDNFSSKFLKEFNLFCSNL